VRRIDHSSRGVLPNVVCHFLWSRNLDNEEALAHWGLSRQKNIYILCTVQDSKFSLSKHITVQWEVNTFDTQFAFLNVSGTLGVPSSGSLYGNTRNALEFFKCVKHRRTSKFLCRSVNTYELGVWTSTDLRSKIVEPLAGHKWSSKILTLFYLIF